MKEQTPEIPYIITVANQKGGVGKSTITTLLATMIHCKTPLKTMVIDGDHQGSLIALRENDLKKSNIGEHNKENTYPIIHVHPSKLFDQIEQYISEYDIIFIDVPGTIAQKEILDLYLLANVVIIPFIAKNMDVNSTIDFVKKMRGIQKLKKKEHIELKLIGIINQYSTKKEYQELPALVNALGIPLMKNFIRKNETRYDRWLNTINPIGNSENDEILLLMYEILEHIGIQVRK